MLLSTMAISQIENRVERRDQVTGGDRSSAALGRQLDNDQRQYAEPAVRLAIQDQVKTRHLYMMCCPSDLVSAIQTVSPAHVMISWSDL